MARTFHISEETFQALAALAADRGEQPEALLQSWLREVRGRAQHQTPVAGHDEAVPSDGLDRDPLAPFLGAFEAVVPDVTIQHDRYLADAYADTHAPER